MSFSALRLAEPIVRAVAAKGYTTATDIQAGAIPPAIDGRDVLGTAQTGTGKTCAFALPILHRLAEASKGLPAKHARHDTRRRKAAVPRALVLCPTRELATQIHESFVGYGRHLRLNHAVVYGGVSQYHQMRAMRSGVDVLVATPGRLKDLNEQGLIDLSGVETLVLDEADRMLDMGFVHDIRQIVSLMPDSRQTLLFSATISDSIRKLANDLQTDPVIVETAPEATTVDTVEQRIYMIEQHRKSQLLTHLLHAEKIERALVFTRTKHGADKVARRLTQSGVSADAIHSNKTQAARNATMRDFKEGRVRVLVATDIASRGIDVNDVTHVVNFDMPIDPETYVHRIGRTARAGASGVAVTFCCGDQKRRLRAIEQRAKITLPPAEELPKMVTPPRAEREAEYAADDRNERRGRRDRDDRSQRSGRPERSGRGKPARRGDSGGFKKPYSKSTPSNRPEGFKPWKREDNRTERPTRTGGYVSKWQKGGARPAQDGGSKPAWKKRDNAGARNGGYTKKFDRNSSKPGGFKPKWQKDGARPAQDGGSKPAWRKRDNAGARDGGYTKKFDRNGSKPGGFKPKWQKDGARPAGGGAPRPAWRKKSDRPASEGGFKPAWKKRTDGSSADGGYRSKSDGRGSRPSQGPSNKPAWQKRSDRPDRPARDDRSDRPARDDGFKKPGFKKAGFKKSGFKKTGGSKQSGFKKNGGYPRGASDGKPTRSGGDGPEGARAKARRAGKSRVTNSNRRGSSKRYA